MVQQHADADRASMRGMLLDESAQPAPYSLVTPSEDPPEDDDVDTQFATYQDREHVRTRPHAAEQTRSGRLNQEPVAIEETPPDEAVDLSG